MNSLGYFFVICGLCATVAQCQKPANPSAEEKRAYVKTNILPNSNICGKQQTDNYFYNDSQTAVDEFPWLVYIVNLIPGPNEHEKIEKNLGVGALITDQFILTVNQNYDKALVKVGEHKVLKERSCTTNEFNEECSDHSTNIPVAESFALPKSTFALLKLKKKIEYTDVIRPICLPLTEYKLPSAGDTLLTSGWGTEEFIDGQHLQIKKRVKHTMLKQTICERGNPIPSPICGITIKHSVVFVCPEDNGGPIMYKADQNWVMEAVVSGSTSCAKHQPASGERFTQDKIDWILEKIYDNM